MVITKCCIFDEIQFLLCLLFDVNGRCKLYVVSMIFLYIYNVGL